MRATMLRHALLSCLLAFLTVISACAEQADLSLATSSDCPSVCFCDETRYVSCVGDGLWEVPTDLPSSVTRLELRNYVVGTLPSNGLLMPLSHLVEVKLQQTQISSIENATFSNLTRLLRLDVSENVLERVLSSTFEGLTSLRYLDLSSNRLSQVDEAFVDLVSLEQLNLRDNSIPHLTSRTFSGLYKLQYLNLDTNNISAIEIGAFQFLTNLAHLIVSNNPLTTLSRLDFFGSRLQYIDVSRVNLHRVPQSLTRYVRDLRLAKNNLTHVRLGDFDSYPYLSLLVLDDNRLVDVESDALGRLEFLVRLWLNGNRLERVPSDLPPSLRVFYVEENLVSRLSTSSFRGLFNLEQLFLKRNSIREIEANTFSDLVSLTHLDLQANLIESVDERTFTNLSSLISLDLSQNPLKTIAHGSFLGLDFLKTLLLSRVKLSVGSVRFDAAVFDPLKRLETLELYDSPALASQLVNSTRALQALRNLRQLNLMHNNLVSLRSDFPRFFPHLKVVKLGGNLWSCERGLLWLAAWLTKSETHFFHSYGIRCSQPDKLLHKPIVTLKEEDFQSQITTSAVPPSISTTAFTQKTRTSPAAAAAKPTSTSSANTTPTATAKPTTTTTTTPKTSIISKLESNYASTTTTTTPKTSVISKLESNYASKTTTTTPKTSIISKLESNYASTTTTTTPKTSIISKLESNYASTTTKLTASSDPPPTIATSNRREKWSATTNESSSTVLPQFVSTERVETKESSQPTEETISLEVENSTDSSTTDLPSVSNETITTLDARLIDVSTDSSVSNVTTSVSASVDITVSGSVERQRPKDDESIVAAIAVSSAFGLLFFAFLVTFFIFRCQKGESALSRLNCAIRRSSSSISYSPHRDEVSIVTVSDGTVGLTTLTHQGLSNKLYFVLENGADPNCRDQVTKAALPDPSLRELLPSEPNVNSGRQIITSNTYRFT